MVSTTMSVACVSAIMNLGIGERIARIRVAPVTARVPRAHLLLVHVISLAQTVCALVKVARATVCAMMLTILAPATLAGLGWVVRHHFAVAHLCVSLAALVTIPSLLLFVKTVNKVGWVQVVRFLVHMVHKYLWTRVFVFAM